MKTTAALKASSLRQKMKNGSNYNDIESLVLDVTEANFLEMKEAYRLGMEEDAIIRHIMDLSRVPDSEAKAFQLACRALAVNQFTEWLKE